ncbi:MAG: single-stranded DNA-binding protein [Myxococcota bacterium]|nr:single-stranded DNA-binding protein [Myxococcota bacterium]
MGLADRLLAAERRLCRELDALRFAAPTSHVYNPLVHARRPHAQFLRRYAETTKRVVYLGMNPGPYGMVQTGVPFGEVALVRDWLGIEAPVDRPEPEHPKRPVDGFACTRSEVSGARLWGAIADHFGKPERFFADSFVLNYCPLVFMEESGRNRTPDKLPAAERDPLYAACDRHLARSVALLEPKWVVGVGRFAEQRAREVLGEEGPRIGCVLHPSPASPAANRGWREAAERQLREQGICT